MECLIRKADVVPTVNMHYKDQPFEYRFEYREEIKDLIVVIFTNDESPYRFQIIEPVNGEETVFFDKIFQTLKGKPVPVVSVQPLPI